MAQVRPQASQSSGAQSLGMKSSGTEAENSQPSFSFVIPCLDAEDTLPQCIEHLRKLRSTARIEIIVVDNGSSDRSFALAQELADQALLDDTATIAGLRNLGAHQATGTIVVFVDSDCLLDPNWVELASKHLEDPQIVMVGAKTHRLPSPTPWVAQAWKIHLDRTDTDPNPLWLVTRALAIRREAFLGVGGFDTELETCEDVALGHALSKQGLIKSDPELAPVHLKDAGTLVELFWKERWRGKDSVRTSVQKLFVEDRWDWKEAVSLALPFYYLAVSCLFIVSILVLIIDRAVDPLLIAFCMLGVPLLALSYDTCRKTKKLLWIAPLSVVYGSYIAARVSVLVWKK